MLQGCIKHPFCVGFAVICLTAFSSCSNRSNDNEDRLLVASAFGSELYFDEVEPQLEFRTFEDSVLAVEQVINQWIKQKVLLEAAQKNLPDELLDKSELIEEYYNDLLIYDYQNLFLAEAVDTVVHDSILLGYYNRYRSNFELKENIVKLIFFKIPNGYSNLDNAYRKFKANDEKILNTLAMYCARNGGNFLIDPNSWLSFNDVLNEIPIHSYNQEHFLNNNKHIRIDGSEFTYFVRIVNFRFKNSNSPFEFEKERIRQIILNKRKIQLIERKERMLVDQAISTNQVRRF